MAPISETDRTRVELQALTRALSVSGGSAPSWLGAELTLKGGAFAPAGPSKRDPAAYRGPMAVALSFGGLLAAFLGCADLAAEVRFDAPRLEVRAEPADPDGLEAIALVQEWQPAGDDRTVLRRLAGAVRNPAYPRAWSAERAEGDSYLVIFREPAGFPVYAFEVNLESEIVEATPEAVERLTMLRVREEVEAQDGLAALAP